MQDLPLSEYRVVDPGPRASITAKVGRDRTKTVTSYWAVWRPVISGAKEWMHPIGLELAAQVGITAVAGAEHCRRTEEQIYERVSDESSQNSYNQHSGYGLSMDLIANSVLWTIATELPGQLIYRDWPPSTNSLARSCTDGYSHVAKHLCTSDNLAEWGLDLFYPQEYLKTRARESRSFKERCYIAVSRREGVCTVEH
ncbi:hypothetical protein PCH_Pc18g06180 [Penicillium rubens Wisconsin 54-1255]|uniref:Uncharacterized protein n=1 Tax=Penicillium rubens (strain ATCC 28089 / DSM 1075 / NRRL 1951 / Wisconsin 54-1255) TaxID=500485 RepID=B6HCJ5_PENRW|nr:hypothetical protein PCH_Pc18g06180 [Penicillium rubens Wisconsin 54-1255]